MQYPTPLSREAITELLNQQASAPVVTIYLPTHRAATPPNMTEDQIRCKNLIHAACLRLKELGDTSGLEQLLHDELELLQSTIEFWEGLCDGLLLCAQPDQIKLYYLPIDTEEYVAVNDHYQLAPVLGLLSDLPEYYVLTVAQHKPVLLQGDMYNLRATSITLPESIEVGLNIDEMTQKGEQQRSSEGGVAASYNGRGSAKNPAENERQRFWRLLDQIICDKTDTKLPLILAGVDNDVSEYRSATHYPRITESHLSGNYNSAKLNELFAVAVSAVRRELIWPSHQAAVEAYRRAKGQTANQALHKPVQIIQAAQTGRVETLLLASVRYTTDTIRDNTEPVPLLIQPPELSASEVHETAYQVWKTGGQIINLEAGEFPEAGLALVATLRY